MKRTLAAAATLTFLTSGAVARADALTCRLALAVVVDKSAAMSANYGMDNMKIATRAAVDHLSSTDCYTVIAFDSRATNVVALRANNLQSAISPIENVTASGTFDVFGALDAAHKALVTVPGAHKRHVILLTASHTASTPALQQLLATMKNEHMTLSAFAISSSVDENMLKALTTTTGGRYLSVPPNRLPTTFANEVDTALKD